MWFIIKKTNTRVATYFGRQPEKCWLLEHKLVTWTSSRQKMSHEHSCWSEGGEDHVQGPFMSAGSLTGHFIWDLVPGTMFHYKWVSISGPVTVLLEISITLSFWAITFKKYDGKKMSKLWPLQFTLHFFRFSVELFIVKNCFHEEAHVDSIGN